MTAGALTQQLTTDAGKQLEALVSTWPAGQTDAVLAEGLMSATDTLVHLTECYLAAKAHLDGTEWQWGSYHAPSRDFDSVRNVWREGRAALAAEIAARGDDEQAISTASMYVYAHDYYHVGQMCALRLTVDPAFDTYSIYA